jgi:hypothetical protein
MMFRKCKVLERSIVLKELIGRFFKKQSGQLFFNFDYIFIYCCIICFQEENPTEDTRQKWILRTGAIAVGLIVAWRAYTLFTRVRT